MTIHSYTGDEKINLWWILTFMTIAGLKAKKSWRKIVSTVVVWVCLTWSDLIISFICWLQLWSQYEDYLYWNWPIMHYNALKVEQNRSIHGGDQDLFCLEINSTVSDYRNFQILQTEDMNKLLEIQCLLSELLPIMIWICSQPDSAGYLELRNN